MPNVAVFFGGRSHEHEISVITGMLAVNLLRTTRFRAVPVYLPVGGGMVTGKFRGVNEFRGGIPAHARSVRLEGNALVREKSGRRLAHIDAALNCCHGGDGEDGTLSALLAWNGIASASPDAAACAVFMDKSLAKIAARGLGIAVAPGFAIAEEEWREKERDVLCRLDAFGYPVVIKPCRLGSSIGVSVARTEDEARAALELAFGLDGCALAERYFGNKRDINCAACRIGGNTVVSECEEVFSQDVVLSFHEKYEGASCGRAFPADLPEALRGDIAGATRTLYEAFRMRGVVRADFLVADGKAYFNELNMVPGSLAAYLFGASISEAKTFVAGLIEEALARPPQKKSFIHTGILESGVFSGAKSCKRGGNFV